MSYRYGISAVDLMSTTTTIWKHPIESVLIKEDVRWTRNDLLNDYVNANEACLELSEHCL